MRFGAVWCGTFRYLLKRILSQLCSASSAIPAHLQIAGEVAPQGTESYECSNVGLTCPGQLLICASLRDLLGTDTPRVSGVTQEFTQTFDSLHVNTGA